MVEIFSNHHQTIAAIATPPGRGGVGIVRISGADLTPYIGQILHTELIPRYAHYHSFFSSSGEIIDEGLAIFFPKPNSFTGEDVLELHGHGGPVILNQILNRAKELGARQARPGEFTERAYINGKIDLTQAEAVADLISASSEQAARCSLRTLRGEFSEKINGLLDNLIELRAFVESSIDFSEEELDLLSNDNLKERLELLSNRLNTVILEAKEGLVLKEGLAIVLLGRPNAGKSSLLNALAKSQRAIVSEQPGTTRDLINEQVLIKGSPLQIIDTAGLRLSNDSIEQEGVRRAYSTISNVDHVFYVVDASESRELAAEISDFEGHLSDARCGITIVVNKVDLVAKETLRFNENPFFSKYEVIYVSVKAGTGMGELEKKLVSLANTNSAGEGVFSARQRHLDSLKAAARAVGQGLKVLNTTVSGELIAEELSVAQKALGEITGRYSSDDLLGKIFSTFCIGK